MARRSFWVLLLMFGISTSMYAQFISFNHDQMVAATAANPFGRYDDGRPKVPDALLEKLRGCSMEEIWAVLQKHDYTHQYEGNFQVTHPEESHRMVGRAVTAQYMPVRPDLFKVTESHNQGVELAHPGEGNLGHGTAYRRMIDVLQKSDVLVVDMFGNVDGGGPTGDNMATAIYAATHDGGMVIDGAVRDLNGILEIPMNVFFRAPHPAAVNGVMLSGINIPIRIGGVTVVPGDVVVGDREGVYFIPPEFVQEILTTAEITHVHDEWTKAKFMTGKYKASDLYPTPWDPQLQREYQEYLKQKLGK